MPHIFNECRILEDVFRALPLGLMVVDDSARIVYSNPALVASFGIGRDNFKGKLPGAALLCQHSLDHECGASEFCGDCVIRRSMNMVLSGRQTTFKQKTKMKVLKDGDMSHINLLVSTVGFNDAGKQYVVIALEDISELILLKNRLSICAECKKIKDENGEWQSFEKYISDHVDVDFSHSVCPDCLEKLYPEQAKLIAEKKKEKKER